MVVLNLTLLVQAVLFLLFLFVMHLLVLRPTLRVLDTRQEKIEEDRRSAESDSASAGEMEAQHASALADVRRQAMTQVASARREAREKHMAVVGDHRKRADGDVAAANSVAMGKVESERASYATLTPTLADAISKRLGLGGGTS